MSDWYGHPAGDAPAQHRQAWEPRGQAPEWLARTDGALTFGIARPTFREPLPIRGGRLTCGLMAGLVWLGLAAAQATSARGYVWATIVAGLLAWATAGVLVRFGDRGVAAGVAMGAAVGVAIAMIVVVGRWAGGAWLLW